MALVADRRIFGAGTSELDWMSHPKLRNLPLTTPEMLVPKGKRLVVCAPHPDDEILPCGGLIAALQTIGREIVILAITDGEGCHGFKSRETIESLRKVRPQETVAALEALAFRGEIIRLGLPDGGLEEYEDSLISKIKGCVESEDILLTPWELDGHPDHEIVWRSTQNVAAAVGCNVLETPIWGWHWSRPETSPMPWERAVKIDLTPPQWQKKQAAIAAFKSQLSGEVPILTRTTLERFQRPWEVYFQ